MMHKFTVVALATLAILVGPTLAGAAAQPEQTYPAWSVEPATGPGYSGIDWETMSRCWHDRHVSTMNRLRPGCTGGERLALGCHWTVAYPSRWWVEQACGRIASWPPDFGSDWWAGFDRRHPAAQWVANLRAGGQP